MVATGWIIAGGIILFIIILLAIPVVVYFDYGEELRLKVKYLFITLYQIPSKPKKRKKKKPKKEKCPKNKKKGKAAEENAPAAVNCDSPSEAAADNTDGGSTKGKKKKEKKPKDPSKPTLFEILELVKVGVDSLSKPLRKLCKRIKICDFDIRMICGGDDAAKAALNFGRMNLLISNALGWMDVIFTLKRPHIDINVDFQSEETVTECSCKVKLSALAALAFVFTLLGRFIARALKSEKIKAWLGRMKSKPAKKKKNK